MRPDFAPLPESPATSPREGVRFVEAGFKTAHDINVVLARASTVEGDFSMMDTKDLLRRIIPADGENYRPIEHSLMTGRFARRFAARLGCDPDLAECAGILHDAGRLVNVHQYFRNDVAGNLLLTRLGLHQRIAQSLQPDTSYIAPEDYRFIDTFTLEQRITLLADICGRPTDTGDMGTFQTSIERHFATRAPQVINTPWLSERIARSVLTQDITDQWGRIYMNLAYWMAENGIDIDEVRWSLMAEDESAPLDTIVFDIGGVFISDSDPMIITDFCRELEVDEHILRAAWEDIVGQLQIGTINEQAFWELFGQKLGKSIPASKHDLFTRSFNPMPDPRMMDLVKRLKDAGKNVIALTDTIPSHMCKLEEAGVYSVFNEVLTSPQIRCSKKAGSVFQPDSELAAFRIAALHAGKPTQGCLMIDDKQRCIDLAVRSRMKGLHFQSFEILEADLKRMGVL